MVNGSHKCDLLLFRNLNRNKIKVRIIMRHYKSWSGLKKQLNEQLCESLKCRITYFLTRYHEVHNSYGRASICLDGIELVNFSWIEMYKQDYDTNNRWKETGDWNYEMPELKEKWNQEATFSDDNFLEAATDFLQLSILDALKSDNYIIRVFAIMDKRVGKRTLEVIKKSEEYKSLPQWVRQFYQLRLNDDIILDEMGGRK